MGRQAWGSVEGWLRAWPLRVLGEQGQEGIWIMGDDSWESTWSSVMVPSCLGVGGAREGTGLPGGAPAHRALLQPGFCPIRPSWVAPRYWQTVDVCSWVQAAGCWSCVRNPELLAQHVWGCAMPQAPSVC